MRPKILVSACLMGKSVRYDGGYASKGHSQLLELQNQGRVVLVCPETAAGLPTPRPPAEIKQGKVITKKDHDLTKTFHLGAEKALELCQRHNIKLAILKENSPSCGSNFIYDGSFTGRKVSGFGVVTDLLRANDISVFSEEEIDQALAHL